MKEGHLDNSVYRTKRLFIVRARKMDADTDGQQRKNVSVKSNCCWTAQRGLIRRHTFRSQPASSALTATPKEKFPPPSKLQILLLRFLFSIHKNPEFRNQQTTPSKNR
jgi:hypothetical protein